MADAVSRNRWFAIVGNILLVELPVLLFAKIGNVRNQKETEDEADQKTADMTQDADAWKSEGQGEIDDHQSSDRPDGPRIEPGFLLEGDEEERSHDPIESTTGTDRDIRGIAKKLGEEAFPLSRKQGDENPAEET